MQHVLPTTISIWSPQGKRCHFFESKLIFASFNQTNVLGPLLRVNHEHEKPNIRDFDPKNRPLFPVVSLPL